VENSSKLKLDLCMDAKAKLSKDNHIEIPKMQPKMLAGKHAFATHPCFQIVVSVSPRTFTAYFLWLHSNLHSVLHWVVGVHHWIMESRLWSEYHVLLEIVTAT